MIFLCSVRARERLIDNTMTSQFVGDAKPFQSAISREHVTRNHRSRSNSRALLLGVSIAKSRKWIAPPQAMTSRRETQLEARTKQKGGRARGARFTPSVLPAGDREVALPARARNRAAQT